MFHTSAASGSLLHRGQLLRILGVRAPVAALACAALVFASAGAAAAAPGHIYSLGEYDGSNKGDSVSFVRRNFFMGGPDYANGQSQTHEMWDSNSANPKGWVETGLVNANDTATGWGGNPGCVPNTCTAYQLYWADSSASTGRFFFHWIANVSPDNTTSDGYEIVNVAGTNNWNVIDDFTLEGTSTVQAYSTFDTAQFGQEVAEYDTKGGADSDDTISPPDGRLSGTDPDNASTTFVQTAQIDVGGTWQTKSWSSTPIDQKCGTPAPPKWPTGYCSNGSTFGAGNWESNLG